MEQQFTKLSRYVRIACGSFRVSRMQTCCLLACLQWLLHFKARIKQSVNKGIHIAVSRLNRQTLHPRHSYFCQRRCPRKQAIIKSCVSKRTKGARVHYFTSHKCSLQILSSTHTTPVHHDPVDGDKVVIPLLNDKPQMFCTNRRCKLRREEGRE